MLLSEVVTQDFSGPVYFPKGKNKIIVSNYHEVCQATDAETVELNYILGTPTGINAKKLKLNQITMPDVGFLQDLPKNKPFSIFNPDHQIVATKLISLLMTFTNPLDYASFLVCIRDKTNTRLLVHSMSVANAHREDKDLIHPPSLLKIFPGHFIKDSLLKEAKILAKKNQLLGISDTTVDINMDFTASDLEPEHWLAYFREDIPLNLHHWHWHINLPFLHVPVDGEPKYIYDDRRGELFLYMHHQIMARYNFERFSNRLALVQPLEDFQSPIPEGYYSKLTNENGLLIWPGRPKNMKLGNLRNFPLAPAIQGFQGSTHTLTNWKDRIFAAIADGKVKAANGNEINITNIKGVDILGNLIESSALSVNPLYYGSIHNYMHVFTSKAHDPDGRFLEGSGVMADTATAMRDPVFYRVHGLVDKFYNTHMLSLPPYTKDDWNYPGIEVGSVRVRGEETVNNVFETFWEEGKIRLEYGLDFNNNSHKNISFKYTRLQHKPFTIDIKVNSTKNGPVKGVVRIFLAPKYNDGEREWNLNDQRTMFIELDRFVTRLVPGYNIIRRDSVESSIAKEYPALMDDQHVENITQCGWPLHLLIPKGIPGGLSAQLVVMISSYVDDPRSPKTDDVINFPSLCGIKGKKYPDDTSMGYPFDRLPPNTTFESSFTPNMAYQDVLIIHKNEFYNPEEGTIVKGINFATHPAIVSAAPSSSTQENDIHYFKLNGERFFFSYLPLANVNYEANWDQARKFCKKIGMDLVSFKNKSHFGRVAAHLFLYISPSKQHFNFWTSGMWVGDLYQFHKIDPFDKIEGDNFKWTSNNNTIYADFVIKSEKPGHCVNVFLGQESANYKANDCSRKDFDFLCSDGKSYSTGEEKSETSWFITFDRRI